MRKPSGQQVGDREATHCKQCDLRSVGWCVAAAIALSLAAASTVNAEEPGDDGGETIPSLSLESLFHPANKFDYDGSLPTTHWVGKEPSVLLIKQDKTWKEVDLESGKTKPWPVVDQLLQQASGLEGAEENQLRSAVLAGITKMKEPDESILLRVGKSLAVVSSTRPARWLTRDASAWRNATLDPTERMVAYTRDGDLFVVDAKTDRSLRLTSDGTETVLDGVLDWTYQEEIFGRGNYRGFWFSPDGNYLAMLRIDIAAIEPYVLAASSSERGRGIVRRYPKAGDPIPHAKLFVWDLRHFDAGRVPPPNLIAESTPQQERIITGVWWNPHRGTLLFTISDRLQTWRELRSVADTDLALRRQTSNLLIREESPTWVEPPKQPRWLADGSLIWQSNLPGGRSRLWHLSGDGQVVTPITPEDFDVREALVRADGSLVMVTGDADRGTIDRHAYRVESSDAQRKLVPLTDQQGWHRVSFSPDGNWLVDRFSTPQDPPKLVLRSTSGPRQSVLAESELKLAGGMVAAEIFHIQTDDGVGLPALLVRPPGSTSAQRCPVVIEVYGGPQSPVVSSRWSGTKTLYRQLLARQGIATLVVDNRSSAGRGIADSWSIRGRVGEVEFQDLMAAVDWLTNQPWVDSQRLAVRGWSFGGFLTLYAMTHTKAFAAGIAGGSVTDWKEYDAFYTERYMGLPSENEEGYRRTAPVLRADQLHGRVLMIHGEADDNVHPSGTLRMARALQKAGKDFRLMIYPGAAHAVSDPKQAWHLAQMTHRFLRERLGKGR
jgi:dipeptidyl-peptidase-4